MVEMAFEERLIAAVSDYPELYNSSLHCYKDTDRKAKAWRAVSLQVEMPEEDCRRKWKSLRDMFIKDKRSEQRRRAAGSTHHSWKFSWHMAFLTPFIQSKAGHPSLTGLDDPDEERDDEDGEGRAADGNASFVIQQVEGEHSGHDGPSHSHSHTQYGTGGSRNPRKRRWQVDTPDHLEDELFLFSLLPYLRRLTYSKKSAVKLKIHQILYDAEFE
ncbi:MADF and BESS domain-containing protein [Engraulis encrasicolus]|uniref:MADF and BESS domain-containing protein n=1 Tax=Engraulis encrasicolus TaxID=184585 RepID=UPI002FD5C7F1